MESGERAKKEPPDDGYLVSELAKLVLFSKVGLRQAEVAGAHLASQLRQM